MVSLYLPRFDPEADYVALRFFRLNGAILERGAAIDKSGVGLRKLQQLYETRHIGRAEDTQVRNIPPPPPKKRPKAEGASEPLTEAATQVVTKQPPSSEERVADLVENNSRKVLLDLAEKKAEAAGLEFNPRANKTDLATLIVTADGAS